MDSPHNLLLHIRVHATQRCKKYTQAVKSQTKLKEKMGLVSTVPGNNFRRN
jgi:hypothetical protein